MSPRSDAQEVATCLFNIKIKKLYIMALFKHKTVLVALSFIIMGSTCITRASDEEIKQPEIDFRKTVMRGFAVRQLDRQTLEDAKAWGATVVRCQLPLEYLEKTYDLTWEETWKRNIEDIKTGLDIARKLDITVCLAMPYIGGEQWDYELGRFGNWEKFWNDDSNKMRLAKRWREIAKICAERDQVVWYDLINEPLDRRFWPKGPPKWADWAQASIDEIRQVDKKGWMVIEPGCGGEMWEGIKTFPRLNDPRLIYSIHLYQPIKYTHQGVLDTKNTDLTKPLTELKLPWPGSYKDTWGDGYWDKKRIESLMEPVYKFSEANPDIPIFVGEFSVARWAPNGEDYLRDCIEVFEAKGWHWVYHAFRESPIWSLEHTEEYTFTNPKLAAKRTKRGEVVAEFLKLNNPTQPR